MTTDMDSGEKSDLKIALSILYDYLNLPASDWHSFKEERREIDQRNRAFFEKICARGKPAKVIQGENEI
jgi:hypothetical protein